jgi:hypothetical protein
LNGTSIYFLIYNWIDCRTAERISLYAVKIDARSADLSAVIATFVDVAVVEVAVFVVVVEVAVPEVIVDVAVVLFTTAGVDVATVVTIFAVVVLVAVVCVGVFVVVVIVVAVVVVVTLGAVTGVVVATTGAVTTGVGVGYELAYAPAARFPLRVCPSMSIDGALFAVAIPFAGLDGSKCKSYTMSAVSYLTKPFATVGSIMLFPA